MSCSADMAFRPAEFRVRLADGKVENSIPRKRSLNQKLCATIFELETTSELDNLALQFRPRFSRNSD
jgi:hypothetical protein